MNIAHWQRNYVAISRQRNYVAILSMCTTGETSYAPCLRHGPVALASSQTQPHFVRLGPCNSNLMLHPRPNLTSFDPTSLHLVRSLYFKLNANFQTQPHFVQLGPCISNSMLSSRPNLTSFDPTLFYLVRSLYFKLNAKFQNY
ncbi:hypothetical protein E4T56_gene18651 [Termitomyces sp. T112]|nr:hypothetical protein E4T56_gene18651 [Termitomyces sp. T112]